MEMERVILKDLKGFHRGLSDLFSEHPLPPDLPQFSSLTEGAVLSLLTFAPVHVVKRVAAGTPYFECIAGRTSFLLAKQYLSPSRKIDIILHRKQGKNLEEMIKRLFLSEKVHWQGILARSLNDVPQLQYIEQVISGPDWQDARKDLNLENTKTRAAWAHLSARKLKNG